MTSSTARIAPPAARKDASKLPAESTVSSSSCTSPIWGTAVRIRSMNGSGAFLFKDLVGAGEKGRRDFDTKRFRRFEIDGKQEFGGLLNRKLSRFGAFQNSIDIVGAATRQGEQVRAVRNQSACLHKLSEQVNRR